MTSAGLLGLQRAEARERRARIARRVLREVREWAIALLMLAGILAALHVVEVFR